jgi:hypothetical protein
MICFQFPFILIFNFRHFEPPEDDGAAADLSFICLIFKCYWALLKNFDLLYCGVVLKSFNKLNFDLYESDHILCHIFLYLRTASMI